MKIKGKPEMQDYLRKVAALRAAGKHRYLALRPLLGPPLGTWTGNMANDQLTMWRLLNAAARETRYGQEAS